MMFLRPRKLPFFIAGSFAASLLTFGAMPAQAADLGSTTATAVAPLLFFSPNPLNGAVGDSFTVTNNSGQTIKPIAGGSTGVISHESSGTLPDCFFQASACEVMNGTSRTFFIRSIGTITFQGGGNTGPLRLESGGGAGTDPALVYPTATINANGGTCTGPTQYIKYQGQNASSGTFTAPTSITCTRSRPNYSLAGWAQSATATTSAFAPGSTVPIGDESFTLFAVWRPNGIEIVYDANVGLETQCLSSNGTNVTTAVERQTTPTVVPASSAAAAQAPCTPPGHTLNGWSLTGAGPMTLVKGAALPASFVGTSQTLYAKWEPDQFGLSVQVGSLTPDGSGKVRICPDVEQVVTFTATKNGVAAVGQVIDVAIERTAAPPITQQKLMTDDSGRVRVNFKLEIKYIPLTVSGSFADQNIRFLILEKDKNECGSVAITGERGTVSGKSGIIVSGVVTGIEDGRTVVPYIRFPGQTTFTAGSARPVITDGKFTWLRKTGKRVTIYVTSENGDVSSNRITIQAN